MVVLGQKGEAAIYEVTCRYDRRPEVTKGGHGGELKVNTKLDHVSPGTDPFPTLTFVVFVNTLVAAENRKAKLI